MIIKVVLRSLSFNHSNHPLDIHRIKCLESMVTLSLLHRLALININLNSKKTSMNAIQAHK